ncbi:MAG TPA: hypothetical protein VFG10_07850 [Saprospiraceae bacterium]|nr:hypothetical protein [Saprospiraceae bacterium]
MKRLESSLISFILIIGILCTSCEKVEEAIVSNGVLSLSLWSDWKYEMQQGIDTIEGIFTNGCEEIGYSAGFFTSSDYTHSPDDVYYEEITIDGVPCKIVAIRVQSDPDDRLFLFFKKGTNATEHGHLNITAPDDLQKYIDIFKTVRFL